MKNDINISYEPHSGQENALDQLKSFKGANFITICASRGFGKTFFMLGDIVLPYMLNNPGCQIMWVTPLNSVSRTPIDEFFVPCVPRFREDSDKPLWNYYYQKNELHIYVKGKISKIFFKSAESPDSIISKGYNMIVVDEAAVVPETVFQQQILACARKGTNPMIFLISTPRGKNWFYRYYMYGQDPEKSNYGSFRKTFKDNPNYSKVLIELMKDLPDHIYRQEYLAEFIDDGGTVFSNLSKVLLGKEIIFNSKKQTWEKEDLKIDLDELYVVSWDLAKDQDYNVIIVQNCLTREVVYYQRINKIDYKTILSQVTNLCQKFNDAPLIYDSTGVGNAVGDFLSAQINVIPFKFTNESKNELINKLIITMENADIKLPNISTIRNEFEAFTFTMTRTGKISYSAPAGMHDDIVIAVALANLYILDHYPDADLVGNAEVVHVINEKPRSFWDFIEDDDD